MTVVLPMTVTWLVSVFTIILEFFASYPRVDSGLEVGGIREGLSRTQKIPHHTDLEVTAKIFTLILLRS